MGYPTIRLENTSLTAQHQIFPTLVACSVMSVSHIWFGAVALGTDRGQLTDRQEDPLESDACDKEATARRRTSFSCSSNRIRRFGSRSSASSAALGPGW